MDAMAPTTIVLDPDRPILSHHLDERRSKWTTDLGSAVQGLVDHSEHCQHLSRTVVGYEDQTFDLRTRSCSL